jgi:sulfate transport system ATP-binding protein
MTLRIENLSRRYGTETVLAGINLDIGEGEFLGLLGPSGAGKTTLLRLIAGLDRPDSGSIHLGGDDVHQLAPRDRRIGFVFQNYALFRHMTVANNIAFGLSVKPRRARLTSARIAERVEDLLGLMQLSGLGGRFPAQLSGGQRQRVALARALAIDPQVLLLDEPFGALDAKVRGELRDWLRGLQRKLGLTTIFVTHDQHEARQLADRVVIINGGRIEQVGTPTEIRERPATPFVRAFLGAAEPLLPQAPVATIAPFALAASELEPVACCAAESRTALPDAVSACSTRGLLSENRLPQVPHTDQIQPDMSVLSTPLAIAAGELWLIDLPPTNGEPNWLQRDALTRANVIVYDRSLTDLVAAVMPLGGYAEPTDGDGLARAFQFIRDGWSVVRLTARPQSGNRENGRRTLVQELLEAGALPDWSFRRLAEGRSNWISGAESRLASVGSFLRGSLEDRAGAVVVRVAAETASGLCSVASNGLAG